MTVREPGRRNGVLFHAKHAYMPNTLGYCGPDDRGRILSHLEESRGGDDLVETLRQFEAAYPFIRLISRETGKKVFDYSVPEAYWIGNELLDVVGTGEFYQFSKEELKKKDPSKMRASFKTAGAGARPHHTFYVLNTYVGATAAGGPSIESDGIAKVQALIDDCRISWGRVEEVMRDRLRVETRPIVFGESGLSLSEPIIKTVKYNSEVRPFGAVSTGDWVSLHWGYACELLSPRQRGNIQRYTLEDLDATNRLLKQKPARR